MKLTMPIQKFREETSSAERKPYVAPMEVYVPLPNKAGSKAVNEVIVTAFSMSRWRLFNPTPEMVSEYNMNPDFSLTNSEGQEVITFFMTLPFHRVKDLRRPDGSTGFGYVLCNKTLNSHLRNVFQVPHLFNEDRCAFCEESAENWSLYNDHLQSLGIDKSMFKGQREKFKSFLNSNQAAKSFYNRAKDMGITERHIIEIIDFDKIQGKRPLREGEMSVGKQVWFSPSKILEGLFDINTSFESNNVPSFYVVDGGRVTTISVTKDTTDCSGTSLMETKYSISSSPVKKSIDPAYEAYINDLSTGCDPTGLFSLMSYPEQNELVGGGNRAYVDFESNVPMPSASPSPPVRTHVPAPPMAMPPTAMPPVVAPPMASKAPPAAMKAPVTMPPRSTSVAPPVRPQGPPSPTTVIPAVAHNDDVGEDYDDMPDFVPQSSSGKW
jgi:hypothetical protein